MSQWTFALYPFYFQLSTATLAYPTMRRSVVRSLTLLLSTKSLPNPVHKKIRLFGNSSKIWWKKVIPVGVKLKVSAITILLCRNFIWNWDWVCRIMNAEAVWHHWTLFSGAHWRLFNNIKIQSFTTSIAPTDTSKSAKNFNKLSFNNTNLITCHSKTHHKVVGLLSAEVLGSQDADNDQEVAHHGQQDDGDEYQGLQHGK